MAMHKLSILLIICAFSALPLGRAAVPPSKKGTPNFYDKLGTTLTNLQKHVEFFDRNKDGIIFPQETYQGMHAIGVGSGLAVTSALLINGIISPKTTPSGQHQSPAFPVNVANIIKAKHNGTGIFDSNGMFVAEKLDEIFATYSRTKPDALTYQELNMMLLGRKNQLDSNGYFAVYSEWTVLYYLAKDGDGFLYKDTVRGVFDGSLFYKLAKERTSSNHTL